MPRVRQQVYTVSRAQKAAALGRLLDVGAPKSALVFCRTRVEVEQVTETLNSHGYRAEALHGGIVQRQRDRVMNAQTEVRVRSGRAPSINQAALDAVRAPATRSKASTGDVEAVFKDATKVVEADYHTPYCDQAPIEPLNGYALVTADRFDFWHPSQHSQEAFMVAAHKTAMPPEKVFFHQTYVGGGFGRRVFSDDARMVVAVTRPVPGCPGACGVVA